jgi:hypothetical protein
LHAAKDAKNCVDVATTGHRPPTFSHSRRAAEEINVVGDPVRAGLFWRPWQQQPQVQGPQECKINAQIAYYECGVAWLCK